jgi:hypothetical protein
MSTRYEPWAGRPVTRDDEGQFAESGGQSWIQRLSDRIGRPQLDEEPPASTWQRGRWRVKTRENKRSRLEDQVRRDLEGPEYQPGGAHWAWRSGVSDDELEGLIQQQVDMMLPAGAMRTHTEYHNGPYAVHVPAGREDEFPLDDMLATVDELVSRHPPGGSRTFRVASDDPAGRPTQHAYTTVGGNAMIFNPRTFDPVEGERIRSEMLSARLVPHHVWVMAHEYGHTLYPGAHDDTGPIWDVATEAAKLDVNGDGMSLDAPMRGPHEIFAEAFAEWFVSNGNTKSVYAKLFAERFGW